MLLDHLPRFFPARDAVPDPTSMDPSMDNDSRAELTPIQTSRLVGQNVLEADLLDMRFYLDTDTP